MSTWWSQHSEDAEQKPSDRDVGVPLGYVDTPLSAGGEADHPLDHCRGLKHIGVGTLCVDWG